MSAGEQPRGSPVLGFSTLSALRLDLVCAAAILPSVLNIALLWMFCAQNRPFVFSIFNLNPAPFCLLDEVDAPLDDANVGRFSELVREMSDKVQFLFVTHNKVTMEVAHQMLGVTMREPGISRLVSVDLEKAVAMAAS